MANETGFRELIGVIVTDHGDGRARAVLDANERHLNAHGTVHGGALATLCDSAMGTAVAAAGAEAPVTVEMKVTYLRPGQRGEIAAVAQVRKRGKRVIVVEAEVSQDGETVALASGPFTDLA